MWSFFLLLQQMPPGTQSVSVLQNVTNLGRGRGTRGVLDWPYPTILDRAPPGRQSSEETMRADFLMSQNSHLSDPSPQGKEIRSFGILCHVLLNPFRNKWTKLMMYLTSKLHLYLSYAILQDIRQDFRLKWEVILSTMWFEGSLLISGGEIRTSNNRISGYRKQLLLHY